MTTKKQCVGTPICEFGFRYSGKSNNILLHTDIQLVNHCGDHFELDLNKRKNTTLNL